LLADATNERSISAKLRRRRDVQLRALIDAVFQARGRVRLIDLGGTVEYWSRVGLDFLKARKATITIVNLHPTEINEGEADPEIMRTQVGDACDLKDVADNAFDLAHSNSVIEHVETWTNMKRFAAETRRVAPFYYVQTPYFWFPVDPHYYRFPLFHWLPRPTRARLLNAMAIAHAGKLTGVDSAFSVVDSARLLDQRQFRFLFPDAGLTFERFMGLRKSMVGIKGPAPAMGGVVPGNAADG
jgi:hypothetical protein